MAGAGLAIALLCAAGCAGTAEPTANTVVADATEETSPPEAEGAAPESEEAETPRMRTRGGPPPPARAPESRVPDPEELDAIRVPDPDGIDLNRVPDPEGID